MFSGEAYLDPNLPQVPQCPGDGRHGDSGRCRCPTVDLLSLEVEVVHGFPLGLFGLPRRIRKRFSADSADPIR